MYPEFMIAPMREELTRFGVRELRTEAEVDEALVRTPGTTMVVVNSVCGCAAGGRPVRGWPRAAAPGEAGPRHDGVRRRRRRGHGAGPRLLHRLSAQSPSIALLRDGKLIYMMERHQIENQEARTIASQLIAAFDKHCVREPVAG